MLLEILLGLSLVILIVNFYKRAIITKQLGHIPLVSKIPFVGSILVMQQLNPDNYYKQWHEFVVRYGQSFGSIVFGMLFVVTIDHRIVDALLSGQQNLKKNFIYQMLQVWLGKGLLLSSGKTWQTMRKIITPTFHFKILEEFIEVFDRQADELILRLTSLTKTNNVVNIFEPMGLLTLDIIAETAMGVKINAQMNSKSDFVKAINDITEIVANRFVRPHLSFRIFAWRMHKVQKQSIKILHDYTEQIIADRRQSLLERPKHDTAQGNGTVSADVGVRKRMALLDVLLQSTVDGHPLSDKQIRDEVNTFMFEGHDTTTSAISFCLYALSRHSDVQQKLFEEIRCQFGDDLGRPVTYADLQQLNYLNCVVKEALRLYPPVPAIGRCLDHELNVDDCTLLPGTNVIILLWELLRDPSIFEEPLCFKPERYLLEDNVKMSGYGNIPFSAGPRNCIGQRFAIFEMKTVIIKVLRNFELMPLGENVQISMKIVLRSKNGVNVGLRRRLYD